ncbi:MAG TPA: hypothetical protein VKP04_06410, partial [Ktedonobacteraceae bacterium]|nr:hypothetical protein [Ktedonobacteraceae bacterium]
LAGLTPRRQASKHTSFSLGDAAGGAQPGAAKLVHRKILLMRHNIIDKHTPPCYAKDTKYQ